MVFMASVVLLVSRRLIRPEVRILTTPWDYTLLILTLMPFVTGFMAYHQWGPYQTMLILHILFAEILLIIIPFSKLGHMALFFFSRTFIGFEMGGRRGARSW
jgi:nitrate reductase gamma subunit